MKTRAYGFSLVELLVSILIGMVAMVFVMRSNVDFVETGGVASVVQMPCKTV